MPEPTFTAEQLTALNKLSADITKNMTEVLNRALAQVAADLCARTDSQFAKSQAGIAKMVGEINAAFAAGTQRIVVEIPPIEIPPTPLVRRVVERNELGEVVATVEELAG